ncbi:MAG: DUF4169 family protein [Pseudomonadota bacterium]
MGDVVSLRAARKAKARAEKTARSAENRARFGRSKAERMETDLKAVQAEARLDGHKRRPEASDEAQD